MRSNKVTFVFIFCGVILVGASLFYFQKSGKKSSSVEFSSQIAPVNYRGPVDDCMQYDILYSRTETLSGDCTENYVHFYPKTLNPETATKTTGDVRIGSFNLFHLG